MLTCIAGSRSLRIRASAAEALKNRCWVADSFRSKKSHWYMSPEQTEGSGTDHRTDIWALGVVLYEMITGQHPFKGDYDKAVMYSILNEDPEPITAVRTGVPIELEVHVGKCLAKDPAQRYQHADELTTDLASLAHISLQLFHIRLFEGIFQAPCLFFDLDSINS